MWTCSFYHIVSRVLLESRRQLYLRQFYPIQAIRLLTFFAIEMGMQVIVVVIVMTMAEFVASTVACTLDGVYQVVLAEKRKGTEDV